MHSNVPQEFELTKGDFIPLNDLLKLLHLVDTGGEANARITSGEVLVNGEVELRKRKKLRVGDMVTFGEATIVIR
ncbi:MAG: RNA-binding S4 domain-containing protein [Lewinellaceae bacterium]|nr:RNA-binding S4 domain-containing protein [Saprospiraceae bacterium]MCB9330338.1 RNA-binding S4 domain-containing protein [Lewinellaceae bacterium]